MKLTERQLRELLNEQVADTLVEGPIEKAVEMMLKPAMKMTKDMAVTLAKATGAPADHFDFIEDASSELMNKHLPSVFKAAVKALKNPKAMMKLAKWLIEDQNNLGRIIVAIEKRIMQARMEMEPEFYEAVAKNPDDLTDDKLYMLGCIKAGACTGEEGMEIAMQWFDDHMKQVDKWIPNNIDALADAVMTAYSKDTGDENVKLENRKMKITRHQLKRIIHEVTDQFQVEYVGWQNQYDQTEWAIKINGEEITAWTSGSPYDPAAEAEYIAENATGEWFEDDDDHPAEEKVIIDALLSNSQFVSDVASARDAVNAYTDSMYADEW